MRHRIGNINTGLGNPTECLLPNEFSNNERLNKASKLMFNEALKLKPIKEYGGFDFKVDTRGNNFTIDFGYEPAYQHGELLIYHIENDKNKCKIIKGVANGYYGSDIEITKKVGYKDFDNDFKNLLDKWHDKLLKIIN